MNKHIHMGNQLSQGRAIVTPEGSSLKIVIPIRKLWFVIVFLAGWLFLWGTQSVPSIIQDIQDNEAEDLHFLVVWALGGLWATSVLLRLLLEREIILIDRGQLSIKKSVLGIGRYKKYKIKSIEGLRFNPDIETFWKWTKNYRSNPEGLIKFDYGEDSVDFARDVDEPEARMIIELIEKYMRFAENQLVY